MALQPAADNTAGIVVDHYCQIGKAFVVGLSFGLFETTTFNTQRDYVNAPAVQSDVLLDGIPIEPVPATELSY